MSQYPPLAKKLSLGSQSLFLMCCLHGAHYSNKIQKKVAQNNFPL